MINREKYKVSTSLTSQYYDNTENKTVVIKDMELEVDDINSLWELLADPYNEGAQEVCINDGAERSRVDWLAEDYKQHKHKLEGLCTSLLQDIMYDTSTDMQQH